MILLKRQNLVFAHQKKICNNDAVNFIDIVSVKTDYHLINLSVLHNPIQIIEVSHQSDISQKNSIINTFSWSGMEKVPENIFRCQYHVTIKKHPTSFTINFTNQR